MSLPSRGSAFIPPKAWLHSSPGYELVWSRGANIRLPSFVNILDSPASFSFRFSSIAIGKDSPCARQRVDPGMVHKAVPSSAR